MSTTYINIVCPHVFPEIRGRTTQHRGFTGIYGVECAHHCRTRVYRPHDRFFAFWFKYVLPNRGRLELGNEGYVLTQIKDTLDLHVSKSYESISREIFLDMAKRKDIPITSLGRWWSKNEEIDLVALDEENKTIWFGECKWSNRKVGTDVYQDLRRKSELVEWHAGRRNERFLPVSYTHLRAHETRHDLVCRLLLEKKKKKNKHTKKNT